VTPWLAGVAAVCALVAVSVVIIQMKQPPAAAGPIAPPPAPELAPVKSATPAPVVDTPAEKPEPIIAKADSPAKPEEQPIAKAEPVKPPAIGKLDAEPPVPVAPPPSEPPVAVTTVPGPPRVAQMAPAPVATSSLEPVAPAPAQPQPAPPVAEAVAPDAAQASADWHSFVNRGDALMQQRQREDALDAYLNAFDLATDGRPVGAAEVAQLCKKVANFQMSFGSLAEARQTLEHGRQTLKRMAAGKDGADRQKYLDQIENTLRSLPRE
jgi:hypothetical protein